MENHIPEKLLYSPNSAAIALDVSRSSIYALMKAGLLRYVKFSNERRIPADEVKRLAVEGMPVIPKVEKSELL
jgi:excisionase family DNA binding protein